MVPRQKMQMPGIASFRFKPATDIDHLTEGGGGAHPARHQDKVRRKDAYVLMVSVFLHLLLPPARGQVVGNGS